MASEAIRIDPKRCLCRYCDRWATYWVWHSVGRADQCCTRHLKQKYKGIRVIDEFGRVEVLS